MIKIFFVLLALRRLMSIRSREIKLRLLDKTKIKESYIGWQLLNTIVPVFVESTNPESITVPP